MNTFPDHPVIAAMETDGRLPERRGFVCRCRACGGAIYPGERYYLANDKVFCTDHGDEALAEVTEYA